MQYAVSVPPFAEIFQPRLLGEMAADAERAGWDGFFVWDHVLIWPTQIADPWIAMAAMALATERIRIGALVTPVPLDSGESLTVEETRQIVGYVQTQRSDDAPFDFVISGHTAGQDATADRARVAAFADAGATWWLDDVSPWPVEAMRARINAGPPR